MGEVAQIVGGGTPPSTDPKNFTQTGGYPWLTPADLSDFKAMWISQGKRNLTEKGYRACSARLLPRGTVLMSSRAPIGYLAIAGNDLCTNQGFKSFTIPADIIPEYLYFWLKHKRDDIEQMGSGSTFLEVSGARCRDIPIHIAPFAEQKRIVVKVEALISCVNAARQRLGKVPAILKRFRQSVLAAGCSGRLTADWRKTNGIDFNEDIDLPFGWRRTTLGDSFRLERGRFLARPRNDPRYYGGKYPFIQIGNLLPDGGIVDHYSQTLNEEGLGVSRMFPKGTPLIAIVGATIGNTGILGFDSCCPDSMVAVQGACDIENKFVEFYLRSRKIDIRESSYASGGQPNINLQTLHPYPVDLPPVAEQNEIVRRLDSLFHLTDTIRKRVAAASARADKLVQAILAKAFRGELVPTEAELARQEGRDYEPASSLLERIRTQRAQSNARPRRITRKGNPRRLRRKKGNRQ
jgi:type I restriction enzyme S subunit